MASVADMTAIEVAARISPPQGCRVARLFNINGCRCIVIERPPVNPLDYRYTLIVRYAGLIAHREGFDTLGDAESMARHVCQPFRWWPGLTLAD